MDAPCCLASISGTTRPQGTTGHTAARDPAQLALALLCDHLDDDEEAQDLYQEFKWQVVAGLPKGEWSLTSADIERALAEIQDKRTERSTD